MTRALTVADVIAGEAVSGTPEERIADMRAIASVIANRANLLGVTQQQVVANQGEFNIYGQRMPPGTTDLVGMAQEAVDFVNENGPVHNATFYATPAAVSRLPGGLNYESETAGHQYFSDPQNRAIFTSEGLISPNQFAYAANPANVPAPELQSGFLNPWSEMAAAPPVEAMQPSPGWGLNKDVAPALTPTVEGWSEMAAAQPMTAPMSSVTAQGFLGAPTSLQANAVAAPSQTPLQSPAVNGFADLAAAGPMGGDFAAPEDRFAPQVAAAPQISQADITRGLFNVTADGQMDPAFTEAMMGPQSAVVPTAVEAQTFAPEGQVVDIASSRFSTPAKTSRIGQLPGLNDMARIDPLAGAIDPTTNTTGFLDQPATPADIGGFLSASAAQRGAPTGLDSVEMDAMEGHVAYEAQKAEAARQAAMSQTPSALTSAQNTGFLNNPAMQAPNFTQAMSPSVPALASTPVDPSQYQMQEINTAAQIPGVIAAGQVPSAVSAYVDEAAATPAVAAIEAQTAVPTQPTPTSSALLSPTSIAALNPTLTPAFSKGILPSQPINQVGFLNSLPADVDINLSGNIVPSSAVTAPEMETVEVDDQPDVASVEGPATIDAVDQQATQTAAKSPTTVARTTPAVAHQPSFADKVKGFLNPGTSIGATIGGFLGLPGAVAGGFLGNGLYQGLQSESQPMSINNIGSGYDNVTSIWSGSQPAGTQATASDGQTVTSLPGGMTAITNAQGVTTTFDKSGKASSYFGSALGTDQDQDQTASTSSGGFFGGLFG